MRGTASLSVTIARASVWTATVAPIASIAAIAAVAAMAAACGGGGAGPDAASTDALADAPADASAADAPPDADPTMPQTLRQTGLYADLPAQILAPGVREYTTAYELWADGATKRRFVLLPPGAVIDTADMDFWRLPVGTRLWKEFSAGGVRVETRLLLKTGPAPGDWFQMAYAWNAAQTDAVAAPDGVRDALDTAHDIPRSDQCGKCHDNVPDVAIGFSAVQLDHAGPGLTLDELVAAGALSDPPAGGPPYFPVPGAGTPARDALGYLHANCGGCHNPHSTVLDTVSVDLHLAVADLGAVEDTPAFRTAVGLPPERAAGPQVTAIVEPGDPDASALWVRMNVRGAQIAMPPLASDDVDAVGLGLVTDWILSLPVQPQPATATAPRPGPATATATPSAERR